MIMHHDQMLLVEVVSMIELHRFEQSNCIPRIIVRIHERYENVRFKKI